MKTSTQQTSAGLLMIGLAAIGQAGPAAGSPLTPSQRAAATSIIRKMVARYSKLSSIQVNIGATGSMSFNGTKTSIPIRTTLALQRPNAYAYNFYLPADGPWAFYPIPWGVYSFDIYVQAAGGKTPDLLWLSMLSDGRSAISYDPLLKQYIRSPADSLSEFASRSVIHADSNWSPAAALLLSLFTDSPEGRTTQKFLGASDLISNGHRKSVAVIECSEPDKMIAGDTESTRCFLAVDVRTGVLRRATTIMRLTPNIVVTMTESISPVAVNQPLPTSLFTFRPPDNARLVAKFEHPASAEPPNNEAKLAAQMVGKPAPDFSLQDMSGKTVDLNSLKGRTILMDFSASW